MNHLTEGMPVMLVVEDNPILNMAVGTILEITDYGALVGITEYPTERRGSGQYRALPEEMLVIDDAIEPTQSLAPKEMGYTGDCCFNCGSDKMVRKGPCLTCLECGSTDGGCS